jgi:hypothetical protein
VALIACVAWVGMFEGRSARTAGREVVALDFAPVRMPTAVPGARAVLAEDAPVIGVVVRGRPRAYSLTAFELIEHHVVNDTVGGVPVVVTFCPLTGCAQVFTTSGGTRQFDVAVGGWVGRPGEEPGRDSVMLVRVGSERYFQDTLEPVAGAGEFPHERTDYHRTTWGQWRREHPQSDVVVSVEDQRRSGGTRQ